MSGYRGAIGAVAGLARAGARVWAWLAMLLVATAAVAQSPLPAELFYRDDDISAARLSPSGRWLAVAVPFASGRIGLAVVDLQQAGTALPLAGYTDADIDDFHWVDDEWLVYDVTDRRRGGGDQIYHPGLFSVRRDARDQRRLVDASSEWVRDGAVRLPALEANHALLHVPADGSREVIVGEWHYSSVGDLVSVIPKRLNVVTGRVRSLAFGAPDNARNWWFGPDGEPRVVVTASGGRSAIHWRAPGQSAWRQLWEGERYGAPFTPRFVDARGTLYVTQEGDKVGRVLKRFDFQRGAPAPEPLVSTPGFDFSGSIVSETVGGRALGVRVQTDAESTYWFDASLKALQAEADRRLPGRVNRLSCRRCGEPDMTVLVTAYSDRDPGQYWVHTARDGAWLKVGERRKGLDPARMASTDFERIPTRDGQQMPVWITKPAGAKGPLPTVVLVHGGPWVRGRHWDWSAHAQFLASRGYVVIEPEFRGSTGYGAAWYRAGWREWGRAMQDDVADALLWAARKGHADAKRACIAGASYGGYAALMGLIRHPELYRCGVAWVAVTDPRLMFKWNIRSDQSDEVRRHDYPLLIGDPVADAERINEVTPVLHAARIRAPLLLAMGAEDRRVPLEHGQRMRDALREAGRPFEWVLYDDEAHGWNKVSTRLDFARRMEAFLAEHLKP